MVFGDEAARRIYGQLQGMLGSKGARRCRASSSAGKPAESMMATARRRAARRRRNVGLPSQDAFDRIWRAPQSQARRRCGRCFAAVCSPSIILGWVLARGVARAQRSDGGAQQVVGPPWVAGSGFPEVDLVLGVVLSTLVFAVIFKTMRASRRLEGRLDRCDSHLAPVRRRQVRDRRVLGRSAVFCLRAAASLVLVLLWVPMAQIFLFGVEFTRCTRPVRLRRDPSGTVDLASLPG